MSETLGQVLQTRPIPACGASYLGGVIESFLQSQGAKWGNLMQQGAGYLLFFAGASIFFRGGRAL
uniref:Uncharacterized protein n=1 Tax=Desulfobacca acetoxidans TaxID=60893 RepID=A0A7V6A2U2_9BACT